jgi:hypothetical protein
MIIGNEYYLFLVEVTVWFDWLKRYVRRRAIAQVADEAIVLVAVKAVCYANELEPKYYGRLPARTRSRLIKTSILDQYFEILSSSKIEVS